MTSCTCGQEKDGKCTKRVSISIEGVLSQKSNCLVMCGKIRKQLKLLKEIKIK